MSSCTSVHIFLSPVVVAFLLCSALQVVTSTGICSEAESRLQCRGRCAAASKGTDYTLCVNLCCFSSSENEFPEGCPLLGYNSCPTPTAPQSPVLLVENGISILNFDTSALDKGIHLCAGSSSNVSTENRTIILVRSVHVSSLTVTHQLLVAGSKNDLYLNVTECYNVSLFIINECGLSNVSNAVSFPSLEAQNSLNLLSSLSLQAVEIENYLPKVSIKWKFDGTMELKPVYDILMMPIGVSPEKCVTLRKTFYGNQSHIDLFPEDFGNNSVWLCFYNIMVSVNYSHSCGLGSSTEMESLKEEQIILQRSVKINITQMTLIWNPTKFNYSLKLAWTVPKIYDLPNLFQQYQVFYLCSDGCGPTPFRNEFILAVKGQLQYEAIIFNDTLQVQQTDYCFYIQPLTSLSVRYYRAQSTEAICLPARGEPPSRIVNITIIEQGNFVRALWHRPTVPSGMVTYSVCISFYRMDGNLLHVDKEFNITTTYYDLNVSRIPEDATDVSFQVSAINSFGATSSPTVVYKYNHTITTSPILEHSREVIGIVVGIVAAATIVVIIVVILIVVIFLLLGNQRKKVNKSIPVDLLLHPKEYEYKLYFKRLPPAMVDRWVIPRHMFNSESFHLLGEGNFSSVYFSLVHGPLSTPTKLEQFKNYVEQSVAVKILKANANEQEMEAFLNEADVLKVLSTQSCPYVVHLVGLQLEHAPPMIAMELVPCGNLLDILRSSAMTDENGEEAVFADSLPSSKKVLQKTDTQLTLVEFQKERAGSIDSYVQLKALSVSQDDYHDMPIEAKIRIKPSQLLKFAIQAVRGMEHLQFFGVLHRDIACRNLLLSANGIVKISDFGFACFLDGKSEVVAELPTDSKPLRWMSPEAFENDVYSEASDVWSFGVALWELFNQGKFPYPTLSDSDVMVAVKTGNYVECPENCDEKVYNLMLNCWMLNPNDRPTFSALKNTLEGFMYDLYPYMMVEVQEVPNE